MLVGNKKLLKNTLEENGIKFDDQLASDMFYSHMNAFWERLEKQELLEDDSELYRDILKEIHYESMEIAEKIAFQYFEKYESNKNILEIVLIATHIQMQIERKDE